ncbi:MAG: zeta toxin family protein [Bacteroidales bacterium]|nr:zeta toxin family protein [Bacteroidales bacterium]
MLNNMHRPELIIIAGPNGSGKTSVTQKFLHHEWAEGTIYINPDEVAKDKFGDWNSREAIISAANYCAEWREQCLAEKKSFVFETVMSAEDKIDFIIRAKAVGFFIRLFFISTSHPSINASRIARRVMEGGHDVPIPKIVSRYNKSIENCKTVAPIVDRLYVYDNSVDNQDASIQYRLTNGKLAKMYVDDIPEWAQIILPE